VLAAWRLAREGLATYWNGSHSGNRAHQIFGNLSHSASSLGQRQAAYVFERAAAQAVAETPRRVSEAATRANVVGLATEAGWPVEAKAEFDRAAALFDRLSEPRYQHLRAIGELDLAKAEIAAGKPQGALQRLETISVPSRLPRRCRRVFRRLLGDSLLNSGRPAEAEASYRRAIDLSEQASRRSRDFGRERKQMSAAGRAFRSVVDLLWKRETRGALRYWEWFRPVSCRSSAVRPILTGG